MVDSAVTIGVAADHAGFELKEYLLKTLRANNYVVVDFGNESLKPLDDFPDYVIPLAFAVANNEMHRGIAICGSGVGACIVANKVTGVRACLIHEKFSAQQGVEDDNMNLICLGGKVVNYGLAWELTKMFLDAKFIGSEKHKRRLAKISALEESQNDKKFRIQSK